MSAADLYVRNARVVTESREFHGGVLVRGGRVTKLVDGDPDEAAKEVIDCGGRLLMPGLIDVHVHFSEPGRSHWEGFETGTRAAAAGGVTTVVEMPLNASPPTIDPEALAAKKAAACDVASVDYALWGGLVDNNLDHLEGLHAGGVIAFKAFMCMSSTDFPRADKHILRRGLERIRSLGSFLAVHAEDEEMTKTLTSALRDGGKTSRREWGRSRPVEAELEAIKTAISLAEQTRASLHIVHVSSGEGIALITEARTRGVDVTAETCPHYLFFTEDDLERLGPVAKCAPPLRSRKVHEELWAKVISGEVDIIASDHSPCLWEEKAVGQTNIFDAWGGISGLQSTLPAMLTEGVHRRGLPLTQLVRLTATNPARRFGLFPRKGSLQPGSDADLVVVDPDMRFRLHAGDLFYRNPHSVYVGAEFKGSVQKTLVRGLTVFSEGQMLIAPGYGRLLQSLSTEVAEHSLKSQSRIGTL